MKNKESAAVFLFAADERKGRAELLSITLMMNKKKRVFLLLTDKRKEELLSITLTTNEEQPIFLLLSLLADKKIVSFFCDHKKESCTAVMYVEFLETQGHLSFSIPEFPCTDLSFSPSSAFEKSDRPTERGTHEETH